MSCVYGSCPLLGLEGRDAGAKWGLEYPELLKSVRASVPTSQICVVRESVKTCSGRQVRTSPRYMFAFWVVWPPSVWLSLFFPDQCVEIISYNQSAIRSSNCLFKCSMYNFRIYL